MDEIRKNIYHCNQCGLEVVTLDIDQGVTPMFIKCYASKDCGGMMHSAFYNCPPERPHQYEWFRPQDLSKYRPEYLDHFKRGGLDMRRRVVSAAEVETDMLQSIRVNDSITIKWIEDNWKQTYKTAKAIMERLISCGVVFTDKDKAGRHRVVAEVHWAGDRS